MISLFIATGASRPNSLDRLSFTRTAADAAGGFPLADLRPEPGGHAVEQFEFQRAQLLRLLDGLLTEIAKFRRDVGPGGVRVDGDRLRDLGDTKRRSSAARARARAARRWPGSRST